MGYGCALGIIYYSSLYFSCWLTEAATVSILACAAQEIKSKLATCSTFCHCNCCPNLCSSLQSDDEESMQLLCECVPKSISTNDNGIDLEKPSSKQSAIAEPSGNASKDKSSTTDPATTTTTYENFELSVAKPDMSTTANASRIESKDTPSNNVPVYTINNNGSTITTVAKPPTTPNLSGNALKKRSATINSATTTTTYGSTEQSELATSTEILSESFRHCLWVGYAMLLLSCQVPYSIMRYQVSGNEPTKPFLFFVFPSFVFGYHFVYYFVHCFVFKGCLQDALLKEFVPISVPLCVTLQPFNFIDIVMYILSFSFIYIMHRNASS